MLGYIFSVEYLDGSTYVQNNEDISVRDSLKNCFYDVDIEKVKLFHLAGKDHRYTIDLTDGHFEVDGLPFFMHDSASGLEQFTLIRFLTHSQEKIFPAIYINPQGSKTNSSGELEVINSVGELHTYPKTAIVQQEPNAEGTGFILKVWPKENEHTIVHCIGWQAKNPKGKKSVKRIMYISE